MTNPLLNQSGLPHFSQIQPQHVVPAIEQLIAQSRQTVENVLQQPHFNWDNLVQPLSEAGDRLGRAWSPVSHLNSVKNSPELREAYQACLPLLSEYSTWLGQHQGLFAAYSQLKNSAEFATLSIAQQKAINDTLRDFELSGIALTPEQQQRYGEIMARLSELSSEFSNNVLDATMGWDKLITDVTELQGLPESALQAAQESAQSKELDGYLFTLEFPSYLPVMTYCENRTLR
ncbi:oligopeptidase A, partial [Testudinibacter aquarius]